MRGVVIVEIIATIGASCVGIELERTIEVAKTVGVNNFRFNFGKYDNADDLYSRASQLRKLKKIYDIKIMLDLPFPYKKPRIYSDIVSRKICKGDVLEISYGDIHHKRDAYTNSNTIKDLSIGEDIIYSDGEGIWRVKEKHNRSITVEALNDSILVNGKSLNYDKLMYCEDLDLFKDAVSLIQPNSVALSFISSSDEIITFTHGLPKGIEIISKIESSNGLSNLEEIVLFSNLMVARGDLSIYANCLDINKNQDKIVNTAKRGGRKVYIATGILSSLYNRNIPSPAEMIDLSRIAELKPDGIVLNYGLVMKNIHRACDIINFITSIQAYAEER